MDSGRGEQKNDAERRSTQCKTRFSNSAKLEGGRVELRSEQVARGVATEISVNQIRIVWF